VLIRYTLRMISRANFNKEKFTKAILYRIDVLNIDCFKVCIGSHTMTL